MKKLLSVVLAIALALACCAVGFTANADEVIKVACIGDSITQGYGSDVFATDSYPAQLQLMLGDKYEVINFGLGGRTAGKANAGSYWKEPEYAESLAYNPDVVIIMMGTNDAVSAYAENIGTYEEDMTALVKSYIDLPSAPEVWIATAPKCGDEQIRADNVVNIIVPTQEKIAAELDVGLIKMYEASCEFYNCFPDKLHPNNTGYARMAQLFYTEIFNGTLYDFTVKAYQGNTVKVYPGASTEGVSAHQTYVIGEKNELTLKLYEGQHTITISKRGYDDIVGTYNIPQENVADFSNVEYQVNLAYGATAFDQGNATYYDGTRNPENVNDGDLNTSWQMDGTGGDLSNIYIGLDFGKATTFNRILLMWEEGTRADRYDIEYSNDGETWTAIKYIDAPDTASAEQTAVFDDITARYVRVNCHHSVNNKFKPQLFEIEVYADGEEQQPVPPESEEPVKPDEPAESVASDISSSSDAASSEAPSKVATDVSSELSSEVKSDVADKNPDGGIGSAAVWVITALLAAVAAAITVKYSRA